MKLQLLDGTFSQAEALEILTQLVHVKIKFLENKIEKSHHEEDIKMRESRIKQLQKEFYDLKKNILSGDATVHLDAEIQLGIFA
jgi:cob(I)alamin adenosyltransferase